MSDLVNLQAESGRDIIGDDATPALTLSSTGGGIGLDTAGLSAVSTTSIDELNLAGSMATAGGLSVSGALGTTPALTVYQAAVGKLSVGVLRVVGNSVASGAAIEFSNKAFASITSVVLTSVANTDYAIRVQVGLETRWIPLFKDAALISPSAF